MNVKVSGEETVGVRLESAPLHETDLLADRVRFGEYDGELLVHGQKRASVKVVMFMRGRSYGEVLFEVTGLDSLEIAFEAIGDKQVPSTLSIEEILDPVDVFLTEVLEGSCLFATGCEGVIKGNCIGRVSRAVFHLYGWPSLCSEVYEWSEQHGLEKHTCSVNGVLLRADGWRVDLYGDPSQAGKKKDKGLPSHIGVVIREDGADFSWVELKEFVGKLDQFFTFVMGCFSGAEAIVGIARSGERVFEVLGGKARFRGKWRQSMSWFPVMRPKVMSQVFPLFCELLGDHVWTDVVKEVLYWRDLAGRDGHGEMAIEVGVISSHTALEKLAWKHFAGESGKTGVKCSCECVGNCQCDLLCVASDKNRRRNSECPVSCKVYRFACDLGLDLSVDGLLVSDYYPSNYRRVSDFVSRCRNDVIHGNDINKYSFDTLKFSWNVAMWCVDVLLLGLCGYKGEYFCRIASSCEEAVKTMPLFSKKN